jgi:hypothetical protein
MRYAQSATEMIPRMRFSIKLKFPAAARVKQKHREKCDRNPDVNQVQHNFQTDKRHHDKSRNDAPSLFILGELESRELRVSRGSPFQLPARLADGLGLESGLGLRYRAPFAPSSSCLEEFGSPASGFRKEAGFRLQWQE